MANNNLEDPRLQAVEEEKQAALAETDALYGNLIQENRESYDALIAGAENYAAEQKEAQKAAMNQTVAELEQDRAQTEKDYTKEQSAAYTDYQKQVNPYGVESEKMAAGGMTGSGYSESAKVSMYNTYQSRVAVAREGCNQAVREYDLAIEEAKRLNSAALAQIAYDALQTQTELSLKALNQDSQLKLAWEDRRQAQEAQFRNQEQEIRKQMEQERTLSQNQQLQEYAALLSQREQENQSLQALLESNAQAYGQKQDILNEIIRQLQDELTRIKTGQAQDAPQAPEVPRPEGPARPRPTGNEKLLTLRF